jgi:conjugative relaxase-like TrwC/TraI family protein
VQLQLLIGFGCDPLTGDALGRAYPQYATLRERIDARVAQLDAALLDADRSTAVQQIEIEESARETRRAVAGFDYTFSVPKSVSVLWGLADAGTQALIAQAHHQAVAEVLGFMEREVAATRMGASSRDGSVVQADVTGLIGTAFDHYDSRAGDPQLHTHVVIANKAVAVADGLWRSLDGRPLHAATVAISEHYNAVLADRLARMFGLGWEKRDRGRDRNPAWEIEGVPENLIAEFSAHSNQIEAETERLIAQHTALHGRRPSKRTIIRLRQQATLATREDKTLHSLSELTAGWRDRATALLGQDATGWARSVIADRETLILRADDVPLDVIEHLGASVVAAVGDKRSTWRRWNLHAEASRQTMGWRFATVRDREAITGLIVDAAQNASVKLTPDDIPAPAVFTRADGTSVFRPRHGDVFSSEGLMAAENRLLALSRTMTGPALDYATITQAVNNPDPDGGC